MCEEEQRRQRILSLLAGVWEQDDAKYRHGYGRSRYEIARSGDTTRLGAPRKDIRWMTLGVLQAAGT